MRVDVEAMTAAIAEALGIDISLPGEPKPAELWMGDQLIARWDGEMWHPVEP